MHTHTQIQLYKPNFPTFLNQQNDATHGIYVYVLQLPMPKLHCGAPTLRCGVRAAPGRLPVSPVPVADGLATGGAEHRGGGADQAVPGEGC